jgi:hypothetical protein
MMDRFRNTADRGVDGDEGWSRLRMRPGGIYKRNVSNPYEAV